MGPRVRGDDRVCRPPSPHETFLKHDSSLAPLNARHGRSDKRAGTKQRHYAKPTGERQCFARLLSDCSPPLRSASLLSLPLPPASMAVTAAGATAGATASASAASTSTPASATAISRRW